MTVIFPQFHHCACEMYEWLNFGTFFKLPCIVRIYAWFFMHCRNHHSDSNANHFIIPSNVHQYHFVLWMLFHYVIFIDIHVYTNIFILTCTLIFITKIPLSTYIQVVRSLKELALFLCYILSRCFLITPVPILCCHITSGYSLHLWIWCFPLLKGVHFMRCLILFIVTSFLVISLLNTYWKRRCEKYVQVMISSWNTVDDGTPFIHVLVRYLQFNTPCEKCNTKSAPEMHWK